MQVRLRSLWRLSRSLLLLLLISILGLTSFFIPERWWLRMGARLAHTVLSHTSLSVGIRKRMKRASISEDVVSPYLSDLGRRAFESIRLGRTLKRFRISPTAIQLFGEVSAQQKGHLFLTLHLGHWEAMGLKLVREGYDFQVVTTLDKHDLLNRALRRFRSAMGLKLLHRAGAGRQIIAALKSGHHVGMFADVPGRRNPREIFFLGQTVARSRAIEQIQKITESRCVFIYNYMTPAGEYVIEAERVPMSRPSLCWVHERMETLVKRYPEQWIWSLDARQ